MSGVGRGKAQTPVPFPCAIMVDGGRKLNPVDNDGSDQLPFNKLYSMTHSDLDTLFGGACYRGYLEWIGINTRVLRTLLQGNDEQPVMSVPQAVACGARATHQPEEDVPTATTAPLVSKTRTRRTQLTA